MLSKLGTPNLLLILSLAFCPSLGLASTPEEVCAGFETARQTNCFALYKVIPNAEALSYALRYLQINAPGLKDASCIKAVLEPGKEGIRNSCQFVLNDMTSIYEGDRLRSQGYFIDLCASKPEELYQSFYVNKGTGTERVNFADIEGVHATNLGAFLTSTEIRPFYPFHYSAGYREIKQELGGTIPALNLIGLHSTNNDTAHGKPMHASPYHSSWGCPSIAPEAVGILQKLATNGPSLVINYGPSEFHPEESLTKCDAVPEIVIASFPRHSRHVHAKRFRVGHPRRHVVRLKSGRVRMSFVPGKAGRAKHRN